MGTERQSHDVESQGSQSIDGHVESLLRWSAQRTTRRSLIGRMGRLALVLAGASSAAVLVPRDSRVSADGCGGSPCSNWRYCGMSGNPCSSCGGTDGACPCGTQGYYYWQYCCPPPFGEARYITYRDCCGCSPSCSTCCTNQKVNPSIPTEGWCTNQQGGSIGAYACTLATVGGYC